jgi:hypothetical protein
MTNDKVVMDIVGTHKLMKLSVIVLGSLSDSDVGRFALPSRIRCVLALCFDVPFLVMAVSMLPVLHVLYSWGPPHFSLVFCYVLPVVMSRDGDVQLKPRHLQ